MTYRNNIDNEEYENKKARIIEPYHQAYYKILMFRNTLSEGSLEWKYLTETLNIINKERESVLRTIDWLR